MLTFIVELIESFNLYAAENQMVAGAISLWGLGTVSYLCKGIPTKIWRIIEKFTTSTVTITNHNVVFFSFLRWYESKGFAKKGRYLKISNGMYGGGKLIKSVGYGKHYFWYKKHLIVLHMTKQTASATTSDKDQIVMTTLGRSHKIYDKIFGEIEDAEKSEKKFIIKKFSRGSWVCSSDQKPRDLNTVFLDCGIKNKMLDHLNNFISQEDWYLKNGLPYQTGILLYGPPGTGKTSIIKSVANYLGYNVHVLSSSSLYDIENAMFELPEKSLIVIEDIDSNPSLKKRNSNFEEKNSKIRQTTETNNTVKLEDTSKNTENSNNMILCFDYTNLSDVLNSIDGVQSNHGRILILTTNDISKLDYALLRPGRIDLKVEIGYVTKHIIQQFFNRFYPDFNIPNSFKVKNGISSATIQNLILENIDNPEKVLSSIKV